MSDDDCMQLVSQVGVGGFEDMSGCHGPVCTPNGFRWIGPLTRQPRMINGFSKAILRRENLLSSRRIRIVRLDRHTFARRNRKCG